jgi:tetratricopeptide (TPR) repeat protein
MGRGVSAVRIVWLALALSVVAPAASAANWTHASSEHFEIYTSAGERSARDTLVQFERIRAFFADHLKLTPPPGRPVRLILFANEREFRPYRINEAVVAYYRPGPGRDYIVMQPVGRASHAVMVHEYVHLILTRSGGRYPVWLNEGLAEYFSTIPVTGEAVPVGRAPRGRVRALSSWRLMSLDRLFAVTHQSPEYQTANEGSRFYTQSWALTHMLLSDERYRDDAAAFLAMVSRGTRTAEALASVYGRTVAEVEKDLDNYVRESYFRARIETFDEPARTANMPTREVSDFEAGLVTANLLAAAPEDAARARTAFEALAREHGVQPLLLDAQAALEIRNGRSQAALPFLRGAVDAGSTDAETYRSLAALLARDEPASAERLLGRSLELEPSSVRARVQLAALIGPRDAGAALAVLASVTSVTTFEAYDVIRLRANAYAALGELDRAHTAAQDLVRVARSRQRRSVANELLTSVEAALMGRREAAGAPAP